MKDKTTIEKAAMEKLVEMLSAALGASAESNRYWLNAGGKQYPKLYPKGLEASPFNALMMALHSDRNGGKTNLFTTFTDAKANGYAVREHEKGVPFLYYNWNKYVNCSNPQDIIPRESYLQLDDADKKQYKGIKNREVRTLFGIEQTLMPMADAEAYEKLVNQCNKQILNRHFSVNLNRHQKFKPPRLILLLKLYVCPIFA